MADTNPRIIIVFFILFLLFLFLVLSGSFPAGNKLPAQATTTTFASVPLAPEKSTTTTTTTTTTSLEPVVTTAALTLRTTTTTSTTTMALGPGEVGIDKAKEKVMGDEAIDVIIKEEVVLEGDKTFYVLTGTRSSVIGMSEYTETLEVWVDRLDGGIIKSRIISQIEAGCSSDSDCVIGGPYRDACTLEAVLPKIRFSDKQDESQKCYALTSCKCLDGFCRWVPTEELYSCILKNIPGDLKP